MRVRTRYLYDASDSTLMDLLDRNGIRYEFRGETIIFVLYKGRKITLQLSKHLEEHKALSQFTYASFSNAELDREPWLTMQVRHGKIRTTAPLYTFSDACSCGCRKQVQPYVYSRKAPWKPDVNFVCDAANDQSILFCSEKARDVLESAALRGITFKKVLMKPDGEAREDMFQMEFSRLPESWFIGLPDKGKLIRCPECSVPLYQPIRSGWLPVSMLQGFNYSAEDAYTTLTQIHDEAYAGKLILISGKMFRVLRDQLGEKNLYFTPVAKEWRY